MGIGSLRDQTTPGTVISSRSAFVKNEGNIIDDLGNAGIEMASTPGNYYLAIKHRIHLSVMSSSAQSIGWITP